MRFGDILRLCRQNLWRRKSRTILTVLGVIVGCCSIVLMVSLGQGINEQNEKMLKSMGDLSIVTVYTNGYAGPMGGGGSSEMGDTKLDDKAVESFRAMSGVSGVTPMMNFPYNVTARAGAGGRYLYDYVQIMGIDMTQFDQMGYKLVGGEKPVKKDQVLAGEWFAYGFMDTLKNGEQRTSTRGGQYSSCTFDQTTGQCEEDQDEDPFFDPLATQISLTTGTNYQGDQYTDASPYDYYQRSKDLSRTDASRFMHADTAALLDRWLLLLKEQGENAAFAQIRDELRRCGD